MRLKPGLDMRVIRFKVTGSRGEAQQNRGSSSAVAMVGAQLFRSSEMKMRLLSLAAAAALLIAFSPGPDARAAAAKLPLLKADTSDLVEVRKSRRKFRRSYKRSRSAHRRSYRSRRAHRKVYRSRRIRRHRRAHRRWRGPRIGIYLGSPRCSWLRRRALLTGSRYWWRRYYRCRAW